jgi:hypothetical protein
MRLVPALGESSSSNAAGLSKKAAVMNKIPIPFITEWNAAVVATALEVLVPKGLQEVTNWSYSKILCFFYAINSASHGCASTPRQCLVVLQILAVPS